MIKILMIENSLSDSLLLKLWVEDKEKREFKTTTARTLRQGISMVEKNRFDLVFLDLALSDSKRVGTIINLVHNTQDIPILVCNDSDDHTTKNKVIESGASGYIAKSKITTKLFISEVKSCIEDFHRAKTDMAMFKHNLL